VSSQKPFFFHFASPQAVQNENEQNSNRAMINDVLCETFRMLTEHEYSQGKPESQDLTTKKETIYNTQRETFRFR
jgi:hypothetical protein